MSEFLILIAQLIAIAIIQKVLDLAFTATKATSMIEPMNFACKTAGYLFLAWFVIVHLFELLDELSTMANFTF